MIAVALAGAGCSEDDGTDSGTGGAAGSHAGSAGAAGFGGAGAAGGAGIGGVGATGGVGASGGAGATGGAAGTGIAVPAGELPTHSKSLPFSYVRPEAGTPIPDSEISRITDLYLGLLDELDYFNFVDLRAHGWPESAPAGGYWYATWWSGIDVSTSGGGLRYYHRPGGADNNGLRTAGLLEGACYAYLSWKKPKAEHLARRLMRGFASWVMAMERTSAASDGLMTRAAYPQAVDDAERSIEIDYSDNRPGTDNGATEYVHVPDNPHWGEIWIKNKRSKDDLGHILRALAQIDACDDTFQELDGDADLREVRAHYQRWAQRVEDDGFKIATYDKTGAHWIPPDLLANFILANGIECTSALAIRLTGRFAPTAELVCGNGIGPLDQTLADLNDQNGEIFRTFHEAAANHALLAGEDDLALALLEGLAIRVETSVAGFEAGTPPKNMSPEGLAELILHSANAGVPLTWREVGWLHDRIEEAAASYSFDNGTFTPSGKGIEFRAIGALLGLCVSQYKNPATKPVFDCAKIAAQPSGI